MRASVVLLAALFALGLPYLVVPQSGPHKTSNTVALAPEAALINGNDDLDPTGNCMPEVKQFCADVSPGEGKLADCLSDQIAESETATSEEGTGAVSDACREEVYQFKIQRNTNINLNVPLARACKVDADKFCNVTWFFGYKAGQVIACLRDVRDRLAPACKREVFKVQLDAAEDYRADALLYEACKGDAESLCKDVKTGGGRVQACLREKRMQLSWTCEEQLFRQEVENADDIRLSSRLFKACMKDKKRFCADTPPGAARVKDCLEEHRNEDGFSDECKAQIEDMMERRVRDFRLDTRLRTACEEDIYTMCAYFGDVDAIDSEDASVIRCLQDYIGEIHGDKCKQQVAKYQELAAQDIRMDVPLADACYEDRVSYCSNVPPGSARVIRCLMKSRERLSPLCRAQLFDEEVRFSQNLDFQFPMKKACEKELKLFCKDVPTGEARAIRCLQDNKYQKDFSKECKEEVRQYEMEAASDYRLNYRLFKACKGEVDRLCPGSCKSEEGQVCGGTVLRCLTDNRADIQDASCQQEVLYFEKMEVSDFRNDVILAATCRQDVERFCAKVEPGEGRVHDCLRSNRDHLSDACRKEELLLEELESENVELRPTLLKACKDERQMFCKSVVPGGARLFRCLAEKMGDLDFGEACRTQVTAKLRRRQANWRLDPLLRKACKGAVRQMCDEQNKAAREDGSVYKCLIAGYKDLDESCQKELGRALHMALYVWEPDGILTNACDNDIQSLCLEDRPNMARTPGAVNTCLKEILDQSSSSQSSVPDPVATGTGSTPKPKKQARQLTPICQELAGIAEPPDAKQAFDASLTLVLLQNQLSGLEGVTGVAMLNRDRFGNARSLTITGWTAVAGMAAMVILVLWGAAYAWRKYKGIPDRDYTMVVKGGRH